jgi:hypothetical protein
MNTSYIAVIDVFHHVRDKYLKLLYDEIKVDGDELIIVNKISDYRQLSESDRSTKKDIKVVDLFHSTNEIQAYVTALENSSNDLIFTLTPDSVLNRASVEKLKAKVQNDDYTGSAFGNGIKINPENGTFYRTQYSGNIMLDSLLFKKSHNILSDLAGNNFKIFMLNKLKSAGQLLILKNNIDYMEFLTYLSEPVGKVTNAIGEAEKRDINAVSKALRKLKKIWIS